MSIAVPLEGFGSSGGAALNFKIVGGTEQPENPSENTIWVNTSVDITGWIFCAEEPSPADPGMVWISVGTVSPVAFNALKKNGIRVYPISAKQYIGGAWVEVTCKSWQGSAWVEWIPAGALYWQGNECADVSGGWQARGWARKSSSSNAVAPTLTLADDCMEITPGSGTYACGVVEVCADQDLTDVNQLTIDYEAVVKYNILYLAVISRTETYTDDAVARTQLHSITTETTVTRTTATLDVSGVSGSYDVAIVVNNNWSSGAGGTVKVYSVLKE